MPAEILALLEVPVIRELLLDFLVWLLSESAKNPQFAAQYSSLISQLRDPNLSIEDRQRVQAKIDSLRATTP